MSEAGMRVREWLGGPGTIGYLWLGYLAFLFIDPYFDHASRETWIWTFASIPVFLALYITGFSLEGKQPLLVVAGLAALGAIMFPRNAGAMAYFIFGSAFIGYSGLGRRAYGVLALYVGAVTVYASLVLPYLAVRIETFGFTSLIGIANIILAESRQKTIALQRAYEEIECLAKLRERARIARDLHDVLGHTLSVIVLKSELAARLAERDPDRGAQEIRAVEHIAREALHDVRNAVEGYRSPGLAAEIERAREVLGSAGVTLALEGDDGAALGPEQERVATLAIREAVTNVVRHARATQCRLSIVSAGGAWRITIVDDGVGARGPEGHGLAGMRERVEALGGKLTKTVSRGTQLVLELPPPA